MGCALRETADRLSSAVSVWHPALPLIRLPAPCIRNVVKDSVCLCPGGRPAKGADRRIAGTRTFGGTEKQDRGRFLIVARMVAGTTWFVCKAGTTRMTEISMKAAGIDTGKIWLDVATYPVSDKQKVPNNADGWQTLADWLERQGIGRVGIEASGGYERDVIAYLHQRGFEVVLLQPRQVRAFGLYKLRRARTTSSTPR
ncbi:hypothetical protein T190_22700 [Sinorhizobium meliloti CCBAU 01290]|nr:hypothetical protein T190_22700 [Sinorhizobium meliloti CCBAU 01290]